MSVLFFGIPGGLWGQSFSRIETAPLATDATRTQGASWIDYDGDGDLDLFVNDQGGATATPNRLYRNEGKDRFVSVTGIGLVTPGWAGSGNCWADYDNDGDLDAFVTGYDSKLFRNEEGTFTDVTAESLKYGTNLRGWACAWGDYDEDGFVDLIITHPNGGAMGPPPLTNFLYHNAGDGTFTHVKDTPISADQFTFTVPSWVDYDLDGDEDLFIGSGPVRRIAPDYLFENRLVETGRAQFERLFTEPIGTDSLDGQVWNWIDYDNDGDLDGFVTNWGARLGGLRDNLYRNEGGTYVRVEEGPGADQGISLSQAWADYDNDGDLDLFVTDASPRRPNRYYENQGGGRFRQVAHAVFEQDKTFSWAATAGDYDNDGDVDLFVGNMGPNPSLNHLYRNDLANGNHWFKVRAMGTPSNRAAIGATLKVKAIVDGKSVEQIRQISSQNTFNGQHSLEVHFGLGTARQVAALEVHWPSGDVAVFKNLQANRVWSLVQGQAPTLIE